MRVTSGIIRNEHDTNNHQRRDYLIANQQLVKDSEVLSIPHGPDGVGFEHRKLSKKRHKKLKSKWQQLHN